MEIKYKNGQLVKFTATRSFALGAFNVQVSNGSEVEFDGSTVHYAGNTYAFPQLRGAVKAGWLVLEADYDESNPDYGRPVSANIKVRNPTQDSKANERMVIATTESDERVVGNHADHASKTRGINKAYQRGGSVNAEVDPQEGVPVRSLKTAAVQKTNLIKDFSSAMQEADSVVIDPGPSVVGRVRSAKSVELEGMKFTKSVGGGVGISDGEGDVVAHVTDGRTEESVVVEDGITMRNTNGPKRKNQAHPRSKEAQTPVMLKDGTEDARRKVAKSMCPDFPDSYDFSATDKKKLARLQADFEDRGDVLRAVFSAESDAFKAKMVEEFPQAFQG